VTWVVFASAAALAFVAAAGVLRPFSRSRSVAIEGLVDPLDEERASLLRALKGLDEERATGQLPEETYRTLRRETEARTVAVLRALEARGDAGDLSEIRAPRERPSTGGGNRRSRVLAMAGASVAVAAVALVLAGAIHGRSPADPITGTVQGGLAFFEQRVAEHPDDVAARLDLAQRYLETGDARSAVQQYVAVLERDPKNAEAHAQLGFLLYEAGKAADGLRAVQQALQADPTYPEALYDEGVILLKGLNRPADAALAFKAYLAAAPFGAHVEEVRSLLQEAESSAG
jgi:tetratricopeptide (TPR) repeat protein